MGSVSHSHKKVAPIEIFSKYEIIKYSKTAGWIHYLNLKKVVIKNRDLGLPSLLNKVNKIKLFAIHQIV